MGQALVEGYQISHGLRFRRNITLKNDCLRVFRFV